MKLWLPTFVLFLSLCASPALAQQQSDWRYVAEAVLGDSKKRYVVQVDRASMRRSKTGVSYWLRIVEADPDHTSSYGTPARGPSLYEDNCLTHQLRLVQGAIIWGYEGPTIPLNRPAAWQYIAPDSLAQITHRFVCKL